MDPGPESTGNRSQREHPACKAIAAAAGLAYAIGFGAFGLTFVWLLISPRRVDRGWMMFLAALALILPLQA